MAEETKKKPNKFKAFFGRIGKFFREIRSEVKKITWPAVPTVFKNMGVTLVVILVVGAFVFALDFGLNKLLGLVMEVSSI
ncbi:MAG: preprotein translocase subunit SecE [Acutalibacteraceae bacterium]|jgi:preprotein translocase subunit SecE